MSPSHYSYVRSKLGHQAIPSEHRVAMCRLAIAESKCASFLDCDSWEVDQPRFVDYPEVHRRLDRYLNENGINTTTAPTTAQVFILYS